MSIDILLLLPKNIILDFISPRDFEKSLDVLFPTVGLFNNLRNQEAITVFHRGKPERSNLVVVLFYVNSYTCIF